AVLDTLSTVWKRVGDLATLDSRVAPYLEGRAGLDSQLKDLALFLRDYGESIDASPGRLQDVEDRIALVDRLKRKYGAALDAVVAHGEECDRQLAALAASDERAAEVERLLEGAEQDFLRAATALAAERRTHATRFAKELVTLVAGLAMERTRF